MIAWLGGLFIAGMALTALVVGIVALAVHTKTRVSGSVDDQAIGFSAGKNGSLPIPNEEASNITGWSTDAGAPLYDASSGAFDPSSGVFTALTDGQYIATCLLCYAASPTGIRGVAINNNAPAGLRGDMVKFAAGSNATDPQCLLLTQIVDLPIGTSVWIETVHDAGAALNITTDSRFSMERVSHII